MLWRNPVIKSRFVLASFSIPSSEAQRGRMLSLGDKIVFQKFAYLLGYSVDPKRDKPFKESPLVTRESLSRVGPIHRPHTRSQVVHFWSSENRRCRSFFGSFL
jgi:hypothetical protein